MDKNRDKYKEQIGEMINELKEENPDREVDFKEDYTLTINGVQIQVSILDIKEPMEKDDEKTNINKMQILFKTKDGYVLIAEVNEDNEINILSEGMKEANLDDKISVTASDKMELEKDENEEEREDEQGEEEKEKGEEEEPELDQDDEELDEGKEEIAKKYNVSSNQVIHISKDKKVTENHTFVGLEERARGYDNLYVIPGKDSNTWHLIGQKDGEETEINEEDNKQKWGKNPSVTIRVEDKGKIREVRPLAMVEINNESAYAIARDETGRPQMIYCRQAGGDKNEFFGNIIPEADGKNVEQQGPEQRNFIDPKNNSKHDLSDKLKELEKAEDLEKRGVPSKEKGVQTYEIDGTNEQNRRLRKEEIKEDLYERKGLEEKMKYAMPGYAEYMEKQIDKEAEEILKLMEEDDGITYEEAVKRIEEKNNREQGGRTPDQKRSREG